jgi:hypothetical protein
VPAGNDKELLCSAGGRSNTLRWRSFAEGSAINLAGYSNITNTTPPPRPVADTMCDVNKLFGGYKGEVKLRRNRLQRPLTLSLSSYSCFNYGPFYSIGFNFHHMCTLTALKRSFPENCSILYVNRCLMGSSLLTHSII